MASENRHKPHINRIISFANGVAVELICATCKCTQGTIINTEEIIKVLKGEAIPRDIVVTRWLEEQCWEEEEDE